MRRTASDVLRELQQRVARLENLRNTSSRKASLKTRLANRQVIAKFYLRDLKKLKKNHVDMLKALIKFLNKQMGTTDITNVDNVDIDRDGMMTVKLKRSVNGHKEWYVATEDLVEEMAIDSMEELMEYVKPNYISFNDYVSDYYVSDYNDEYNDAMREDDPDHEDHEWATDADHLVEIMMDEQGLSWSEVVSALSIDTRGLAREAVEMDGIAVSIGADQYWDIRGARNSYVAFTR